MAGLFFGKGYVGVVCCIFGSARNCGVHENAVNPIISVLSVISYHKKIWNCDIFFVSALNRENALYLIGSIC